jgi:hypothetical protein
MSSWKDWNAYGGGIQSIFIGDNVPHKRIEAPSPWDSPIKPSFKYIGEPVGGYRLIYVSLTKTYWSTQPNHHGWHLIGKKRRSVAEREWHEWLREIGAEA